MSTGQCVVGQNVAGQSFTMGKFTGSTVSERIMGAPIVLSASVMSHVTDEVLLTVLECVLIPYSNF